MNEQSPARRVGGSFYFNLVICYGSMVGLLIWNTRDFPQCRVPALLFIGFCAVHCWIAEVHLLPGLQAKTLPRKPWLFWSLAILIFGACFALMVFSGMAWGNYAAQHLPRPDRNLLDWELLEAQRQVAIGATSKFTSLSVMFLLLFGPRKIVLLFRPR